MEDYLIGQVKVRSPIHAEGRDFEVVIPYCIEQRRAA